MSTTPGESPLWTDIENTYQQHADVAGVIPRSLGRSKQDASVAVLAGRNVLFQATQIHPYISMYRHQHVDGSIDSTLVTLEDGPRDERNGHSLLVRPTSYELVEGDLPQDGIEEVDLLRAIISNAAWDANLVRNEIVSLGYYGPYSTLNPKV
jgi:hypothetical protein